MIHEKNEKEFEFLGITRFHSKGFTGKNVIVASKERTIEGVFDDIYAVKYEEQKDKYSMHGTSVMDYIRQVVPDAKKMAAETTGTTIKGVLYSEGADFFKRVIPDVLTTSFFLGSDCKEPKKTLYKELYDKGCFLCSAAGNSGLEGTNDINEGDVWKAIGACRYNSGKPKRTTYSSVGKELDFMEFDYLYSVWDNSRHKGTSFSSPLFASMVGLVQDFFLTKTGKKLSHEKLVDFIKDNCSDLGNPGFDEKNGYGLFILPDPDSIDIARYSDVISLDELFEYLQKEGELLEPDYWKEKIVQEDKLKWMFIKWANAVNVSRISDKPKDFSVINDYNIDNVLKFLTEKGYLLEPDYWKEKIAQEDKLKWMFFKWYYALQRVI